MGCSFRHLVVAENPPAMLETEAKVKRKRMKRDPKSQCLVGCDADDVYAVDLPGAESLPAEKLAECHEKWPPAAQPPWL